MSWFVRCRSEANDGRLPGLEREAVIYKGDREMIDDG